MTPRDELLQEQGAVILIAPQGAGKTRHAESLMQIFGCATLVEEWDGESELPPRALALTHALPKPLDARELATVLAALRTRQWDLKIGESSDLDAIATSYGAFDALSLEEIDDLYERLNA